MRDHGGYGTSDIYVSKGTYDAGSCRVFCFHTDMLGSTSGSSRSSVCQTSKLQAFNNSRMISLEMLKRFIWSRASFLIHCVNILCVPSDDMIMHFSAVRGSSRTATGALVYVVFSFFFALYLLQVARLVADKPINPVILAPLRREALYAPDWPSYKAK